ncbi:MAG: MarR family transcriptional regulator [Clostridiales bacterium]|nr:MarR family transcriptional regulator [Clostridiales bacterium]
MGNENAPDVIGRLAKLSRMSRRHAKEHHVSHRGSFLLGVLLEEDGMRTTDLAVKLDIRPSSVTDALRPLEEGGYIRREKDEADSRVIRIYATDKAREEHAAHAKEHQSRNERLLASLTMDEARAFCETCDKLCAFFEKEYPQDECARTHRHSHINHCWHSHWRHRHHHGEGPLHCGEGPQRYEEGPGRFGEGSRRSGEDLRRNGEDPRLSGELPRN